ncbi:MAG: hypothetical protein FWF97_02565 [Alphaproteobacteria bacterium]|nr:hypothetical protein [Alphaproteobacteria bacterium]
MTEPPTDEETKTFQTMITLAIAELSEYPSIMALLCGVQRIKSEYEKILSRPPIFLGFILITQQNYYK